MAYDSDHLTKLGQLKLLAEKLKEECAAKSDLEALETQVGAIKVPKNVSELNNDSGFQNSAQVNTLIQAAIAKTGHASFKVASELPAAAEAEENVLYLYKNESGHYDIYARVQGDAEAELVQLDDTSVDLSGYVKNTDLAGQLASKVDKDGEKQLSTEDFTTDLKTKLEGIQEGATKYTHPASAAGALAEKLYKITTDANGHVTKGTEVTKADITALGITDTDTTYEEATEETPGLMSAADKKKLNGMELATDGEVTEMIGEVFPSPAA